MSRFIVLEFPKHKFLPNGRRDRASRLNFDNNEVGARAYCKLMTGGGRGQRGDHKRRHVIDQHLRATTYRV